MKRPLLTFDKDTHIYRLDGEPIPSVTQVLRATKIVDFSSVRRDVLEAACKFGTAVHKAIELYDLGTLNYKKLDSHLKPYLESWKKFLYDYHVDRGHRDTIIEDVCFSARYRFACTPDRVFMINRKRTLLDIKTSGEYARWVGLQTAGNKIAYEEMKGKAIYQRWAVLLSDEGYKVVPCDNRRDKMVFISALNVCNWMDGRL